MSCAASSPSFSHLRLESSVGDMAMPLMERQVKALVMPVALVTENLNGRFSKVGSPDYINQLMQADQRIRFALKKPRPRPKFVFRSMCKVIEISKSSRPETSNIAASGFCSFLI